MSFFSNITDAIGLTNVAGDKAAKIQTQAIAQSQQILADSNVEAARLIAGGQEAAARAIEASGRRAAEATLKAAELGREQIQKFFEIADAKLEPFRQQGVTSSREIASMLGIADDRGRTVGFDSQDLENTPQFQFQLEQGTKAIDRGSRSKLSGGQLKDLQTFGNGLASNVFNDRISQLLGLSGIGANAGGQLAQAAISAGAQMGTNFSNQGNALSSIFANQGNALANNATQGANALAGLESQFGQQSANNVLGVGTVNANNVVAPVNRLSSTLGTAATLWGLSGFKNPMMKSAQGNVPFTGTARF